MLVYSPATQWAAVLEPRSDGTLEVLAVLGMHWQPEQVFSRLVGRRVTVVVSEPTDIWVLKRCHSQRDAVGAN